MLFIIRWSGAQRASSQRSTMADSAHTQVPGEGAREAKAGLPSRMTVMGLGRKPSPPGHKVLYSAVEKVSQGDPELGGLP